jgi:hypothetical protein
MTRSGLPLFPLLLGSLSVLFIHRKGIGAICVLDQPRPQYRYVAKPLSFSPLQLDSVYGSWYDNPEGRISL